MLPCTTNDAADGVIAGPFRILLERGTGHWYPVAKGFGQLLNLNCAVMIVPVVRSVVKWLHDLTSISAPWYLRWIPYVLQLDKNIVTHKVRAFGTLAHAFIERMPWHVYAQIHERPHALVHG